MAGRVLVSVVCVLARLPKRFIVICSFQNQRTPAPALGSCRNISGQICTKSTWQISSPAVAERPRDASCLSVVCYNSKTRRAQSSVVSYFRFRFTAAYKLILFSSVLFVMVVHAADCGKQRFNDAWRSVR